MIRWEAKALAEIHLRAIHMEAIRLTSCEHSKIEKCLFIFGQWHYLCLACGNVKVGLNEWINYKDI